MLTQFRILYPKGSVISELITIDHGKYIVRVLIKVGSITLGTGLAGADTIEQAEDTARNRALELLQLDSVSLNPHNFNTSKTQESRNSNTIATSSKVSSASVAAQISSETPSPEQQVPVDTSVKVSKISTIEADLSKSSAFAVEEKPTSSKDIIIEPLEEVFQKPSQVPETPLFVSSINDKLAEPLEEVFQKPSQVQETSIPNPEIEKITTQTSTMSQELSQTSFSDEQPSLTTIEEPLEFSEIIVRSDIEMKRLGWTNVQGREYLIQTYGKRSRQVLSDEELLEFLYYLESLPTPS